MTPTQNKRTIIKEAIESGKGYTKIQLMELANVNAAGFASQLSYLRMSGVYPVADPDTGIFKLVDEKTWNELQSARAAGKPKEELTPQALRKKLETKAARAASAQTNAKGAAEKDPSDKVLKLKAQRANIELEICEIELGRHQKEFPDLEAIDEASPLAGANEEVSDDSDGSDELM